MSCNAVPTTECASQKAITPDKTVTINSDSCNVKVANTSQPASKALNNWSCKIHTFYVDVVRTAMWSINQKWIWFCCYVRQCLVNRYIQDWCSLFPVKFQ